MRPSKSVYQLLPALLALMLTLLPSCSRVYDDLSACPQGVAFQLTSLTPCGDRLSLDAMKALRITVHDATGGVVEQYNDSQIQRLGGGLVLIPFNREGSWSFTLWGAEDAARYENDATGSIRLLGSLSPTLDAPVSPLFFGRAEGYSMPDRSNSGTQIDTLKLNVSPYDYRIFVTVGGSGLDATETYDLIIEDDNAAYDYLGRVIPTPVMYTASFTPVEPKGTFSASLSTLKLRKESAATLIIRKKGGKEVSRHLLSDLIKEIEKVHGNVINLECVRDLHIKLTYDHTNARLLISINDWNVVIRQEILE